MKDILTKEKINEIIQFNEEIDSLLKSYLAFEKGIICDKITWHILFNSIFYIEYVDKSCKQQTLSVRFEDVNNTFIKRYVS